MGRTRHADLDLKQIGIQYIEGKSLRELAKSAGVSHVHLSRLLKASGVSMRKRSSSRNTQRANTVRTHRHVLHAAHAVILYAYGVDVDEIAVSLNRSADWVRLEIRAAGVPFRD